MKEKGHALEEQPDGSIIPVETTVSESPSVTGYGALLELAENWEKSAEKDNETYGHDGNEWYRGRSVTYASCAEALKLLLKEMAS